MISAYDQRIFFERWPAWAVLLFCEPMDHFFKTADFELYRRRYPDWAWLCVGNESPFEYHAAHLWCETTDRAHRRARRDPPQRITLGQRLFICANSDFQYSWDAPEVSASVRIILFQSAIDAAGFQAMLTALPQRRHVALGGAKVSPQTEFTAMLTGTLNHQTTDLANGDQLFSFADTPHTGRIKMLAALSRGLF